MKNDELLHKIANNPKVLFWILHIVYIIEIFSIYNLNYEILYFDTILILILIFFAITSILFFVGKRIFKDLRYVFCVIFAISLCYFAIIDWLLVLIIGVCLAVIFITFKFIDKKYFDNLICVFMLFVVFYFIFTMPKIAYSLVNRSVKNVNYDEQVEFKVDETKEKTNIYWIHCDAMMSFEVMDKYFKYSNDELLDYLKKEKYIVNENASFNGGHSTYKSLVALFNPQYYDNFFKSYLDEIKEISLDKKSTISTNVSSKELVSHRFDNELMNALKENNYTTVAISKFNLYSSLNTDVFYDFYNYSTNHWHFSKDKKLVKFFNKNDANNKLKKVQLSEFLTNSILGSFMLNDVPSDYELIDYNDFNFDEYSLINETKYWQARAILKSIDDASDIESKKFFFINYDLNHPELSFDREGRILDKEDYYNLNYYVDNYIYSSKILMELLNYIKDNDSNAIIVLQGDHGINKFSDDILQIQLKIEKEQVQELKDSVISAIYLPKNFQNGDEEYLKNPLNISRYLVNNFVGENYKYIEN